VRGNNREAVFEDDVDRSRFLELLSGYKEKLAFRLHAYVLMTNHFHLLIESGKVPLSRVMQMQNSTYTQYFNRRHERVGHVFQGRYKAIVIDQDAYLALLVRYIHLNPVRAGLVEKPEGYPWSSHTDYARKKNGATVTDTETVLRLFSEDPVEARRLFRAFGRKYADDQDREELYAVRPGGILGDERFADGVLAQMENLPEFGRKPTLEVIGKESARRTGVSMEEIKSVKRNPRLAFARGVFLVACRESGHRLVDVARLVGRDLSAVSRWAAAVDNPEGRRTVARVVRAVKKT